MSRAPEKIVAEIKTLYARRHEEKLVIQKDMVVLRDEHGWSNHRIANETGIPRATVINWLEAYAEGGSRLTPTGQQAASDARVARRVLAEAPAEVIERMIDELPKKRQQQVAAAAGHAWAKARVEYDERERNLTPVQRKEREANRSTIETMGALVTAPFVTESVVILIEQATDKLREMNAANVVLPELARRIGEVLTELNQEYEVACAMAGLETDQL